MVKGPRAAVTMIIPCDSAPLLRILLCLSPIGQGRVCEQSRLLRSLLKNADEHFLARYALRVQQEVEGGSLALRGFFAARDVWVPVPGSAPETTDRTWVADKLATALVTAGLGQTVWPALRRICGVRKSAYALTGARPSVECHYQSFAIEADSRLPDSIILIDDVVTKGRTLLAAAARLRESFPNTPIKAFALVRTMGLVADVASLLEPCRGEIDFQRKDAHRHP